MYLMTSVWKYLYILDAESISLALVIWPVWDTCSAQVPAVSEAFLWDLLWGGQHEQGAGIPTAPSNFLCSSQCISGMFLIKSTQWFWQMEPS